jgi:hypothetical protein
VTAGSNAPDVTEAYKTGGAELPPVCVSSDAYGSMPKFDAQKRLIGYDYGRSNRGRALWSSGMCL